MQSVFVSFYPGQAAADLLTPVSWEELAPWTGEPGGRMSGAYREYKERKAEECLSLLERRLPQLRGSIEDIYTSTPLTYRRYTRACEGSAFGIKKDCRSPLTTVLSPLTPVGNLLLSGQHLNLHGVLGVSMTAMMTCAAVLGKETLVRQCENPLL